METLIKASVNLAAGYDDKIKNVEYFNSDLWIFYAHGAGGAEKVSYKLRSEGYAVEHDLTPPAGQKLYQVYGVVEDGTYIYCLCRTVASAVMQVVQITTAGVQTLKTTTYTPLDEWFISYAYAAQTIFCQTGLFVEAFFDAIIYDFAANTYSTLTQPADPGTTCWSNNHFMPTLYLDKIYTQFMSYQNAGNWGTSHLLYFDTVTGELGLELFEYSFDPKFEEGYAKVFTLNGLAASENSLLAIWSTAVGSNDTFPVDMTDRDTIKVYSFVIIKNLITGAWDQYQQITEENWYPDESYQSAGQIQRGTYVFFKTIGNSPFAIGANWSMNGIFKNYYNPIVGTSISGFHLPYNTISCYVPIVYYKANGMAVDLYVLEQNFFGIPPKPMYLTDITQWDLYGFRLYANYRGFEEPTKMEIDIDTAAGANVVQRTVTTSNTWVETLASDGLGYAEYKWRCRFIDGCNNDGVWSEFTNFWIREKPTFTSVAFDSLVTQRPNLVIDLNDFGCPIDTITIEIKDATTNPHWHSGTLKAALYYDEISDTYIIPIDTHGYIKTGVAYTVTTVITNTRGRYNTNTYNPTPNFATVASPTNVTVTKYNGYIKLSWTASAATTGYKIYKTIAGVRAYIETTTGLYYNDLSCEMNTPITYGVSSYDSVSQSADVSVTDSIITNYYALVCEDLWNLYVNVPQRQQLGQTKDNNMESTGPLSASKFKSGTANFTFDISQYDFKNFEDKDDSEFYVKVKNEVYHVQFSSYSVDRNRNTQAYRINASLIRIFDTDILNDWYLA